MNLALSILVVLVIAGAIALVIRKRIADRGKPRTGGFGGGGGSSDRGGSRERDDRPH